MALTTQVWMAAGLLALVAACVGRTANEPPTTAAEEKQAAEAEDETKQIKGVATGSGCMRAGCSGELCVSVDSEELVTPCQWQPHFACYKTAKCELQQDGSCGWTETDELRECIENAQRQQPETQIKSPQPPSGRGE